MTSGEAEYPLYFWGIGFRSLSHLHWFQGSVFMLTASLIASAWCLKSRPSKEHHNLVVIFLILTGLFHALAFLTASVSAYKKTYVLHQDPNGPLFSVDCIWWNALLTVGYVGLVAVLRRVRQPQGA